MCKSCLCAVVSRSAATVQMVCSGGWQRKTSHVLRDAHAYMLISIPTATSTIFGAFQAMFSSFQVGRRHVCFSTIARFGWWTHLSTRIRRRNCDQGSRPDRRLRRAADRPVYGQIHLKATRISRQIQRTTFGRTGPLRRPTKFDCAAQFMRTGRCSGEPLVIVGNSIRLVNAAKSGDAPCVYRKPLALESPKLAE